MQGPMMQVHEGEDAEAIERWEARAEHDVGVFIARYLAEHPCPASSVIAARLEQSAQDLQAAGQLGLDRLGQSRLRAV